MQNAYGAPYGANTAFGAAVDIGKILRNGFKYLLRGTFYSIGFEMPLRFKLGGRPILSADLKVETALPLEQVRDH